MSRRLSNIGLLISLLVIFTVVYLPIIQTNYVLLDDYNWIWVESPQIHNRFISGGIGPVGPGRFIENYFFYIFYGSVNYFQSLDFASAIRFTSIIGITLLAYVLFNIFKANRIKTAYSFIGSILICTLPAFQLYVSWIHGISKIYCALLSSLSGLLMIKVLFKENSRKLLEGKITIFLAMFLLVIALSIYQPAAMIYFAVAIIPLARLREEDLMKKWYAPFIVYFSVGFISLAVYFIIVKIVFFITNQVVEPRGAFVALTAIPRKLYWFLHAPLRTSLNLWNIFYSTELGITVGIIIMAGFLPGLRQAVLHERREERSTLIWNHFKRLFLIMSIIPLSYLPNFLVKAHWTPYRTLASIETAICILLFISLLNIDKFLTSIHILSDNSRKLIVPAILIILTIFTVYSAHGNVKKYFAELQSLDLKYVKNIIQAHGISKLSDASRIYVRESDKPYSTDDRLKFEFGQPSSNNSGFITSVVKLALYDLGIKKKIEITQGPADAPLPEESNVLIIDFTQLKYFLDKRFRKDG